MKDASKEEKREMKKTESRFSNALLQTVTLEEECFYLTLEMTKKH